MTRPATSKAHAPTLVTRPVRLASMPDPTAPPALPARPNSPIRETAATAPATTSTPRGLAFGQSMYALSAIAAATGTNHALPKANIRPSRIPARIEPAWLAMASRPSRAASISSTPRISRT
ncbi:MAG: hypothetical protein E6I35_08625 [Chloroflexi bacterium]|nr:MAG: hypothetical protein E6I35_08625 [Chloroflexota bacterium]